MDHKFKRKLDFHDKFKKNSKKKYNQKEKLQLLKYHFVKLLDKTRSH